MFHLGHLALSFGLGMCFAFVLAGRITGKALDEYPFRKYDGTSGNRYQPVNFGTTAKPKGILRPLPPPPPPQKRF